MALCQAASFRVRAMFGEREISGWRLGDWAAHRQIDNGRLWGLTLLPTGLSLPFAWASFPTGTAAIAAMADIVRMRNSWSGLDQSDFTAQLRAKLIGICGRHGAVDGGLQVGQRLDGPRFGFGLPMNHAIN